MAFIELPIPNDIITINTKTIEKLQLSPRDGTLYITFVSGEILTIFDNTKVIYEMICEKADR